MTTRMVPQDELAMWTDLLTHPAWAILRALLVEKIAVSTKALLTVLPEDAALEIARERATWQAFQFVLDYPEGQRDLARAEMAGDVDITLMEANYGR
jgi:hypothetical protein